MLDALKEHWGDLSTNFLNSYMAVKLWLWTVQYVAATGDMKALENLYGYDSDAV